MNSEKFNEDLLVDSAGKSLVTATKQQAREYLLMIKDLKTGKGIQHRVGQIDLLPGMLAYIGMAMTFGVPIRIVGSRAGQEAFRIETKALDPDATLPPGADFLALVKANAELELREATAWRDQMNAQVASVIAPHAEEETASPVT